MDYLGLLVDALKYVLATAFITSAVIGMLIVTTNFLPVVQAGEHILRFITGDNPNRLQAILLISGTVFAFAGLILISPALLASGFILLGWAALHYHHHHRRSNTPRQKK